MLIARMGFITEGKSREIGSKRWRSRNPISYNDKHVYKGKDGLKMMDLYIILKSIIEYY